MPGMVYAQGSPLLAKWLERNPVPPMLGSHGSIQSLLVPFIYEPGTSWTYSHSIDWAGILIERISGLSLEDYMRINIFDLCEAKSLTFLPTEYIRSHKMALCTRDPGGAPVPTDTGFGMSRPTTIQDSSKELFSGGGGLYGTQKDYLAVLRGILRCDPRYRSPHSKSLLSERSYAELFKSSVSTATGHDGCQRITDMVSKPKYFEPQVTAETVNHSIACLINLADFTGRRKAQSGCWSGAAKTQWWLDPHTGIAVSSSYRFRQFVSA